MRINDSSFPTQKVAFDVKFHIFFTLTKTYQQRIFVRISKHFNLLFAMSAMSGHKEVNLSHAYRIGYKYLT